MRTNFSGNNEEATASFSKEEATASLSPIKIGANSSTASDITKKEESEKNRIMAIQKDAAVQKLVVYIFLSSASATRRCLL